MVSPFLFATDERPHFLSPGLRIADHFGNFFQRNVTDLEFGIIDSDKAIAARIKHEGKLDEKVDAHFQCALLYTSAAGERRVRVHNLAVPVTSLLANVFRLADMDTTLAYIAKECQSFLRSFSYRSLTSAYDQQSRKQHRNRFEMFEERFPRFVSSRCWRIASTVLRLLLLLRLVVHSSRLVDGGLMCWSTAHTSRIVQIIPPLRSRSDEVESVERYRIIPIRQHSD